MDILAKTAKDVSEVARKILEILPGSVRIVLLRGDLGAGKTAVVKEVVKLLGSNETASSPTFSLINEYDGPERIFHIDLYRLETLEEVLDIGIEEYLDSGAWVFIEWPSLVMPAIATDHVVIDIEIQPDSSRIFRILIDSTLP